MIRKSERRLKIKAHIRRKVSGTAERPRLTVFRSNTQIYAQVIDDVKGVTLASASSLGIKDKITKCDQAAKVGELIAKKARENQSEDGAVCLLSATYNKDNKPFL